jgi:hypothetical protein
MGRVALVVLLATAGAAHAEPSGSWGVTAEAGAEIDDNVTRVETGPDVPSTNVPIAAPVARFGVRLDARDRAFGGGYVLSLSDLTRIIADNSVPIENVTLLAGDLRWMHPVGSRPVSVGAGVTAADALPLSDPVGDRTFELVGADLLMSMRGDDDHRLLLAVGGRSFVYKAEPTHVYDWDGPSASARLDWNLWHTPERTRSLELATTLAFEARAYDAVAVANVCTPGMTGGQCTAPTDLARRDRFTRAAIDLTWVGRRVFGLGYELVVIDSNSYGESFVRHRITASATTGLPGDLFASLIGILDLEQYLDGSVLQNNVTQNFTNIEDENRSSLQARLARKLTAAWSLEARAAIWSNFGNSSADVQFHRELAYLGVVYAH